MKDNNNSNNLLEGLGANDGFGNNFNDNGFEEVESGAQNADAGIFEENADVGGGGLGAMMGLEDGMEGNDDLT